MTEAAKQFLRSFQALPQADQHDVLVSLLRLPVEADYMGPSDEELVQLAELAFSALDDAEKQQ